MADSESKRYIEGMKTRRAILGDRHVERAVADTSEFDAPFQELITEMAWGHVWSSTGLTQRERSMITIALLAALGHDDEVAMHIRAAQNTGASRLDIRETLMHVAIYAGIPTANHAIKVVKKAYTEIDQYAGETPDHD